MAYDTLPYTTFSSWLRARYGTRVYKVALDPGLGCPNRDGTLGRTGCSFCDECESGHPPARAAGQSLAAQFARQVRTRRHVDPGPYRFLAYLQAGSGTHGPPEVLRRVYAEVRALPDLVGVSIATRPDLVPDDRLDLVAECFAGLDVWIELGVQSAHDRTLAAVGRRHTFADAREAIRRVRERGFFVCAHVILGLPDETPVMIRQTATELGRSGIDGVKLHGLFVARGSALEHQWRAGEFQPLDEDAYVSLAADFLERTPASTVVQRLVGRGRPTVHLSPEWMLRPKRVQERIARELERRGTRQGTYADRR